MKKLTISIMALIMMFMACSCGVKSPAEDEEDYEEMIECQNCGEENEIDTNFCQECGEPMEDEDETEGDEVHICWYCGEKNGLNAKYCRECGEAIEDEYRYEEGEDGYEEGEDGYEEDEYGYEEDEYGYEEDEYGYEEESDMGESDCAICAYDGYDDCIGHDCISCDGEGYIKCFGCVNGYTAYGPCPVCYQGWIDCNCDNGVVYYDIDDYGYDFEEIEYCSDCEYGYVKCTYCDGTGKSGTYTVGGFDGTEGAEVAKTCPRCGGRKKVSCSTCGGDGEM